MTASLPYRAGDGAMNPDLPYALTRRVEVRRRRYDEAVAVAADLGVGDAPKQRAAWTRAADLAVDLIEAERDLANAAGESDPAGAVLARLRARRYAAEDVGRDHAGPVVAELLASLTGRTVAIVASDLDGMGTGEVRLFGPALIRRTR